MWLLLCLHMSECAFVFQARSVNVKSRVGSAYQNISSLEITGKLLHGFHLNFLKKKIAINY